MPHLSFTNQQLSNEIRSTSRFKICHHIESDQTLPPTIAIELGPETGARTMIRITTVDSHPLDDITLHMVIHRRDLKAFGPALLLTESLQRPAWSARMGHAGAVGSRFEIQRARPRSFPITQRPKEAIPRPRP